LGTGAPAIGSWANGARVIGQKIAEHEAAREHEDDFRTYITYSIYGKDGTPYYGRASGFGTPQQILSRRFSSHHMRLLGYGSPQLDKFMEGPAGRLAIRGREQQLIDSKGGIGSGLVGNMIRGVGVLNPNGKIYHEASSAAFGEIAPYTGWLP
jgi:hypothetical protein